MDIQELVKFKNFKVIFFLILINFFYKFDLDLVQNH